MCLYAKSRSLGVLTYGVRSNLNISQILPILESKAENLREKYLYVIRLLVRNSCTRSISDLNCRYCEYPQYFDILYYLILTADTPGLAAHRDSLPWILSTPQVSRGSVQRVMQVLAELRPSVVRVLAAPKYSRYAEYT